jgi:hypothetical protein
MGVPVWTLNDFYSKLSRTKNSARVVGFLLYDSRPSHKPVESFIDAQTEYIDDFARNTGIYFFYPFRVDGKQFRNPSPDIAREFNIDAKELPGILIFVPPPMHCEDAVYLPLKKQDFTVPATYETIFNDVSEILRRALAQKMSTQDMLIYLAHEAARLKIQWMRQRVVGALARGTNQFLLKLPAVLLEAFGEGLGKAVGEKAIGQ